MTTIILILAAVAAVFIVVRSKRASSSNTSEDSFEVSLYHNSGYPLSSQITPDKVYVPSLGHAPRTLRECAFAGWYETKEGALFAPVEAPVPPPFGGTPQTPGELVLYVVTGKVTSRGAIVPGTWNNITRV